MILGAAFERRVVVVAVDSGFGNCAREYSVVDVATV